MANASIEKTLELRVSSLGDVKARMRGVFSQERVAASAGWFLDRLLSDGRRETGWMRAEAAGDRVHQFHEHRRFMMRGRLIPPHAQR